MKKAGNKKSFLSLIVLSFLLSTFVFSSASCASQASKEFDITKGFGIMGDSTSDEYQSDDQRGSSYSATTFNWVEQLARIRGLNFGPWGDWGEPRRTGYEYNWSRSAATASSLISSGQHTGLAQQVAEGKVSYVLLWIGTNDFHFRNGTYAEIYDGSLSDANVQIKVDSIVADITLAVDTVLAAGPEGMVVVNIGDIGQVPLIQDLFPDPAGRQRVTNTINSINDQLAVMAAQRDIKTVDMTDSIVNMVKQIDENGFLYVADEPINMLEIGDEPHHWRLNDPAGHPGTVISGLMANFLFVEPFNKKYDLKIPPLSDQEILENAGIDRPSSILDRKARVPLPLAGGGVIFVLVAGILKFKRH